MLRFLAHRARADGPIARYEALCPVGRGTEVSDQSRLAAAPRKGGYAMNCHSTSPRPRVAGALLAIIAFAGCGTQDERDAVTRMRDASQTGLDVQLEDGRIRTARGRVKVPGVGSDAAQVASAFVDAYADAFGLTDVAIDFASPLVLEQDQHGAAVALDRVIEGVPVFGAQIRVHLDGEGFVRLVSAVLPSDAAIESTTPAVDESVAVNTARTHVAASTAQLIDTTLVVFNKGLVTGGKTPSRLAWMVKLRARDHASSPVVFVDALTGSALASWDLAASAKAFTYDAKQGDDLYLLTGTNDPSSDAPFSSVGCGFPPCDAAASIQPCCAHNELWLVDDDPPPAGASAIGIALHSAVRQTQAWFSARFARDGWDGKGGATHTFVHYGSTKAEWEPHYQVLLIGDRQASADFVTHEYTHAVGQSAAYSLVLTGQSGALAESFADVFTYFIYGDWQITNAAGTVERDLAANATRTIADTMADFRALGPGSEPNAPNDYGHIHYNSGIPSRVAQLLITGGSHWYTSVNVVAVDKQKVEQIWYRALQLYLLPTASFEDARYQLVAACESLVERAAFGIGLRDCGSILQAFNAVGIGEYDTDRDTWHDGMDNCVDTFNPAQDPCDAAPLPDTAYCPVGLRADGVSFSLDPTYYVADGRPLRGDGFLAPEEDGFMIVQCQYYMNVPPQGIGDWVRINFVMAVVGKPPIVPSCKQLDENEYRVVIDALSPGHYLGAQWIILLNDIKPTDPEYAATDRDVRAFVESSWSLYEPFATPCDPE